MDPPIKTHPPRTPCRVDDVAFDVAVLTNLSREHLGPEDTMEEYVEVAGSLFSRLTDPDTQRAVINVDGAPPPTPPFFPASLFLSAPPF